MSTVTIPRLQDSSGLDNPRTDIAPIPSGRASLDELLTSAIVLREDFEQLAPEAQDEIQRFSRRQQLLPALVRHGLLTEYQAARVEAGTTFGLVLGHYRVLDRLGAGAMGVVFRAEHVDMRRIVAIKVMPMFDDESHTRERRFLTEIRSVAQLQHPNIVAAMDSGTAVCPGASPLRYFVMELVAGQDLEEHVASQGPLGAGRACDVIHQIAAALAEAHTQHLVHRDIKPSNIRLTPEGQAKLLDFGLARDFEQRITEPGTVLGTPAYMAPEQAGDAASVDIRADIYGLGATLYWCLTGEAPFLPKQHIVQQLAYRQTQPAPSVRSLRPEISTDLDAVVARMMALRPQDRYATPHEVMEALVPFLQSKSQHRPRPRWQSAAAPEESEEAQRKHSILVVDDEPGMRAFCRCTLQSGDGPIIDEAADGALALEMIAGNRYDLVLLDIAMPGITGTEVCRRLRDQPPYPHLKIIMMSGGATSDEMARMLLEGADDYLTKPLSLIRLRAKVKSALCLKDAQDRSDLLNSRLLAVNRELEQTLRARDSDLVGARNGLVRALARLVQYRAGETAGHLLRMERYSRLLAEAAATEPVFAGQIDPAFIELLACCAPLHDIGTVALPDHILSKAGELTANERILMQTHTTLGSDTLREVMKQHGSALAFLQMAADIARHHHERFDGTGYPDQLAGASIPLSARIVAIGDVYDALRSRRTYKPALSHVTALQMMTAPSQGQFDPQLLQVFQRRAGEFEKIFREVTG